MVHSIEKWTQIHLHNNHNHHAHHNHKKQWRIQEFTNGGGAISLRYNIWGLEIVLMPLTHTLCFCSESIRIIYIFLTLHVDCNKVYACYAVKIFKYKPIKKFQPRGGGALDPPLKKATTKQRNMISSNTHILIITLNTYAKKKYNTN